MRCAKLILISYFGIVYCRPQGQETTKIKEQVNENGRSYIDADSDVEIERQLIEKVTPVDSDQHLGSNINPVAHRNLEASTKEILEKIAEVNKNQGLVHKKPKPNYFHFPFSYSRSQKNNERPKNFKFSTDPFSNPVLAYLESERRENNANQDITPSLRRSNLNAASDNSESYVISMTDNNAEIKPEDQIPGQYIRRKVTHYQGFIMPNPYMFNPYNIPPPEGHLPSDQPPSNPSIGSSTLHQPNNLYQYPALPSDQSPSNFYIGPSTLHQPNNPYQFPAYPTYPMQPTRKPEGVEGSEGNKNLTSLEKKTVENVKNIVRGTNPIQPQASNNFSPNYPTPYYSNLPVMYPPFLGEDYQDQQQWNVNPQSIPYLRSNMLQRNLEMRTGNLNTPNTPINYATLRNPSNARQNWNWPGANLFPIYVRDPFLQMYYAITNMIEYGPNSGSDGPCKLTPRPQGNRIKVNPKTALNVNEKAHQVNLEINKMLGTDNIKMTELDGSQQSDNMQYLDVEDIDIGGDELVKFTINLPKASPSGGRELKDEAKFDMTGWDKFNRLRNESALVQLTSGKLDFMPNSFSTEAPLVNRPLTPIGDQILHAEELEDEAVESEKAEDISISNQGIKKVFSRENTGNGIFIHKLKVRQGGVAIAGPGGIATAGSGGTAIVGPNGIAYTHPDGLAIAGSGTKVVAVDPDIDLNDVIKDSVLNGTRHVPNTRVGKVVAVGPVVYYNRG